MTRSRRPDSPARKRRIHTIDQIRSNDVLVKHLFPPLVTANPMTTFAALDRFAYNHRGLCVSVPNPKLGETERPYNLYPRALVPELRPHVLPEPRLTRGGHISTHQPDPPRPLPYDFFLAQLIHYGLPFEWSRDGAMLSLARGIQSVSLRVPSAILQVERRLKERWNENPNITVYGHQLVMASSERKTIHNSRVVASRIHTNKIVASGNDDDQGTGLAVDVGSDPSSPASDVDATVESSEEEVGETESGLESGDEDEMDEEDEEDEEEYGEVDSEEDFAIGSDEEADLTAHVEHSDTQAESEALSEDETGEDSVSYSEARKGTKSTLGVKQQEFAIYIGPVDTTSKVVKKENVEIATDENEDSDQDESDESDESDERDDLNDGDNQDIKPTIHAASGSKEVLYGRLGKHMPTPGPDEAAESDDEDLDADQTLKKFLQNAKTIPEVVNKSVIHGVEGKSTPSGIASRPMLISGESSRVLAGKRAFIPPRIQIGNRIAASDVSYTNDKISQKSKEPSSTTSQSTLRTKNKNSAHPQPRELSRRAQSTLSVDTTTQSARSPEQPASTSGTFGQVSLPIWTPVQQAHSQILQAVNPEPSLKPKRASHNTTALPSSSPESSSGPGSGAFTVRQLRGVMHGKGPGIPDGGEYPDDDDWNDWTARGG